VRPSEESTGVSSDRRHGACDGGQAASSSSQRPEKFGGALKASHEEIWYLESIDFASPSGATGRYNIITQNYKGYVCVLITFRARKLTYKATPPRHAKRPFSFIAICNILILREQIKILPSDRTSASYEFLAQLVGEHILLTAPGVCAALSMMPLTTSESRPSSPSRGSRPKVSSADSDARSWCCQRAWISLFFTSPTAFRPATTGGELAMFASAGITLAGSLITKVPNMLPSNV
jgi:hypothetical protein